MWLVAVGKGTIRTLVRVVGSAASRRSASSAPSARVE